MSVVHIEHLSKTFRQGSRHINVLNDVSMTIPKGMIKGVIGRSGAGKSTLVRCINGLESYDTGTILINNQELSPRVQRRIGNVFQNFNLLSRRMAIENIALPLEIEGMSSEKIADKCTQVLEWVGLSNYESAYPSQLSGGQRQRVAIARAIVGDVDLLLCDEFTSALDPETSLEILALLKELNRKLGLTMLLITHDMNVIREICDNICVLDKGSIVERGSVASVFLNPQHTVTQNLVRGLFIKELPYALVSQLTPIPQGHCVIRLIFSEENAQTPVIASIVETYHTPVNIIAGSLDHIREMAFGSLLVSIPHQGDLVPRIMKHLAEASVSAEILGYLP